MPTILRLAAILLSTFCGAAFAERPATEAQARYYIYSGLLTQAAQDIVAPSVALGPELSKRWPDDAAKVYQTLVSLTDGKSIQVRKATPEELRAYGARPGLHEKQPFYAVDAGDVPLLVQYDLRENVITFVGERNTPWEAPKLIRASTAPSAAGATRPARTRLDWTCFFAFDSAALTAEARASLDHDVFARLADMEVLRIDISGHADAIGPADYNHDLSERRAAAVSAYLEARGVDAAMIGRTGFGKTHPVKFCPTDAGRAALIECLAPNRRVVVEIAAIPK